MNPVNRLAGVVLPAALAMVLAGCAPDQSASPVPDASGGPRRVADAAGPAKLQSVVLNVKGMT